MRKKVDKEKLLSHILSSMEELLILVDYNLCVEYMNEAAERILNVQGVAYKGKHIFNDLRLWDIPTENSKVQEVLVTGVAQIGVVRTITDGKQILLNITPLIDNGKLTDILITGQDITETMEMQQELDMAFALTLPNSKVEYKLKSTVEYQDTYDPQTKKITITGIIHDGGYRHVVNCLKILASLHEQGITKLIGIDKDLLVQALIFHDLGKSQPVLKIGDVVDPREVFEDGKLHAFRGAEIAKHYYGLNDDIVEIIRYHHHSENELTESFSWRLSPMFRLFQLIDGLSAAMTRGSVKPGLSVRDSVITVTENNNRPQYNGTWQIDLYTGKRIRV
ncbi:HD domain-containing protein [Effusibacillus dendaii]|uniref:PAS domain-containing protein n=1 Tax=Effusibacillus dendaii TaxID=2743772 RepID=A0A7I8DAB7_9BACL|nr:HD domain-containing protein [Effusibacillus dendaii]BCJ87054.1 hypothetical protein skT53_20390 [Effusibacillus dendaii]